MNRQGKVALGYLHPGHVEACFHESLIDMLFYDASMNQRFVHKYGKMGKRAGSGGIVDGRNQFARILLDESDADWLMMIDSDMGFAPDTVERLVDAAHARERPVVGALCFGYAQTTRAKFFGARWECRPTLYNWVGENESSDGVVGFASNMNYERNRLQPVDGTGAACVLIHRLALQTIRDRFGDCWFDPITHPGGRRFSEDLSFCLRLGFADIPIFVHTGIKTTHCKGAIFYDEDYFDTQQMVAGMMKETADASASA